MAELRWIAEGGAEGELAGAAGGGGRSKRAWLRRAVPVAGAVMIALLAWPAILYVQGPPDPDELRFRIPRNLTAQPDETQGSNSAS